MTGLRNHLAGANEQFLRRNEAIWSGGNVFVADFCCRSRQSEKKGDWGDLLKPSPVTRSGEWWAIFNSMAGKIFES